MKLRSGYLMVLEPSVEVCGGSEHGGTRVRSATAFVRLNRAIRTSVLLSLATFGVLHAAQAAHPHKEHKRDYKREIETVEQQWRTAQIAGDVATMNKLLAEDYLGISNNGQLNNKTQQLERLQKRMLVLTRIDVSDVKIKVLGHVGIVTSQAQLEGTNDGKPLQGLFRYTRIYKRYPDGTWKITNFEVTRVPANGERGAATE